MILSRPLARDLPRKVVEAILAADASKLPADIGVDAGAGTFVVARILKLLPRDPAVIDEKRAVQQYAQAWSNAETQAYYEALKTRFKAVVKPPQAAASSVAP